MSRHVTARWLRPFLVLTIALFAAVPARAAWLDGEAKNLASEARLRKDVTFLASPECEGRGPTTLGLSRAADHIANEFKKAGLKPGNPDGTYFQTFTIPGTVLDAPATLTLKGPQGRELVLQQGVHFYPMGMGGAGKVEDAKAVFAGYGRKFPADYKGRVGNDPVVLKDYDDFAGLDVKGKVVVVINDTPRGIRADAAGRRGGGMYLPQMLQPRMPPRPAPAPCSSSTIWRRPRPAMTCTTSAIPPSVAAVRGCRPFRSCTCIVRSSRRWWLEPPTRT
jgi:hypothetical protein